MARNMVCYSKFNEGEHVRISRQRSLFEKSYFQTWSSELFKVSKIHYTKPCTYSIKDLEGNEIKGTFYEQELSKSKYPDMYLVERITSRSKQNPRLIRMKWLGFPSTYNSYTSEKDIMQ